MTIYAVADHVPEGCDYLTAGKEYEVIDSRDNGFLFIADDGVQRGAQWNNSYHLHGGDWRRKDTNSREEEVKALYRKYPESLLESDEVFKHQGAMTTEGLHKKYEIAAELAYRDIVIRGLQAQVAELEAKLEPKYADEPCQDCGAVLVCGYENDHVCPD